MANRDFKVRVWKPGQAGTLELRISAATPEAARRVSEESGWIVEGIEAAYEADADPATLDSLAEQVRELRSRVESLHRSPIISRPTWTVFLAALLALVAWFVVSLLLWGRR